MTFQEDESTDPEIDIEDDEPATIPAIVDFQTGEL